jgi:hypothetical protein
VNERTLATLRAFCEIVCPGLASDATPGAPDLAAERYVAHFLEPGTRTLLADALDGGDQPFLELDAAARAERIERMRLDAGLRRLVDGAAAATLLAVYGSWSGEPGTDALARVPLGWDLTGFPGPTRSRLDALDR